MAKKKPEPELEPPDLEQCQCLKPNGHSFMTFGGKPGRVRCEEEPTVIVHELIPGADGLKGSMSLCGGCLEKLRSQAKMELDAIYHIEPIEREPEEFQVTELEHYVWCRECGDIHIADHERCDPENYLALYVDAAEWEKYYE